MFLTQKDDFNIEVDCIALRPLVPKINLGAWCFKVRTVLFQSSEHDLELKTEPPDLFNKREFYELIYYECDTDLVAQFAEWEKFYINHSTCSLEMKNGLLISKFKNV